MRKIPLFRSAALAAALAACGAAAAQSSVTVYGVLDLATEASNSGNGTNYRVISGGNLGSRLGFRGTEDLGGGLSAVFRIEQGINADDGSLGQGGRAWGREASVGLASRQWGLVQLGRLPTPYYAVHNTVDAFAWVGSGGVPSIGRSTAAATRPLTPMQVAARTDNSVGYVSPSFGGFEFRALVAAGEGQATLGRAWSASGKYAAGRLALALGYVDQEGANNANGSIRALVAGGSYDFGPVRLFAGVTDEKNSCTTCTGGQARMAGASTSQFRLLNLGVRVPVAANTVAMAQVIRVNDRSAYTAATGDRDATWLAVGAEYTLSRRTMIYGTIGTIDNKNGSQYALASGTAQQPAGAVGAGNPRATTAQVGIRHTF